jgi:hypothetical protein
MDAIKAKSNTNAAAPVAGEQKWERATGTPAWEKPPAGAVVDNTTGKITADVQSAKLKQLLGKINTN